MLSVSTTIFYVIRCDGPLMRHGSHNQSSWLGNSDMVPFDKAVKPDISYTNVNGNHTYLHQILYNL